MKQKSEKNRVEQLRNAIIWGNPSRRTHNRRCARRKPVQHHRTPLREAIHDSNRTGCWCAGRTSGSRGEMTITEANELYDMRS
jgi:hypothetical protein